MNAEQSALLKCVLLFICVLMMLGFAYLVWTADNQTVMMKLASVFGSIGMALLLFSKILEWQKIKRDR